MFWVIQRNFDLGFVVTMSDLDQDGSSRSSSRGSSFSLCHMTESAYAKVIFCEIHDSYSAESDVECLYQLSESIVPHRDDYIGLFRVGWQDLTECITSVPCSSASCNSSLAGDSYNKIIFKVKDLPKDDVEYYQFLYLTKDHEICGASTPFKFHTVHEDENVVVLSAEHDFLEVKTSTSLLQHRLAETQKYVAFLEKAKQQLENKVLSVEEETIEAKAQIQKEKLARQDFEAQVHSYLSSLMEGEKDLPVVTDCSKILGSSLQDLKCVFSSLSKNNNTLKVKSSVLQRDLAKIKTDFEAYKAKELKLTMQNTAVADSVRKSLQELSKENFELKEEKSSLQKALSDTKDLFRASEDCKSLVRQELENVKKSKDEMASSMEDLKLLNSLLKKQLANNEIAIKDMENVWKELEELKLNFDSEKESWDKHRSDLEQQVDDLAARLVDAVALQVQKNKQCSELVKQIDDLTIQLRDATGLQEQKDKQCIRLEQQINDLTVRLKEAAELYKKQFIEIKTLKKALKSESSRRKHSSEGAVGVSSICFSSDGVPSLEGTQTSLSASSMSPLVQSLNSEFAEQIKAENSQLQSTPHSRPANLSGSYIAWSGCSSFADIAIGKASAPVEEETGFCDMSSSATNEMDSSLRLMMVTGNKSPAETVFVRSAADCCSPTNTSRSSAQQERDIFSSSINSHEEPNSLYHENLEIFHLPCPLCEDVITVCGNNTTSMDDHLLNVHQQQLCPVCGRMFDKGLPSNYFKYHVENHFTGSPSSQ